MDAATIAVVAPMVAAAISAMFWVLVRDKDKQIADKQRRIEKLEAEVAKLNDIVDRNTAALTTSATSQEKVVTMLRDLLGDPSPTASGTPRR